MSELSREQRLRLEAACREIEAEALEKEGTEKDE
jgi:hypothetical protein